MLAAASDEPEVGGLLALMLLHHARRAARTGPTRGDTGTARGAGPLPVGHPPGRRRGSTSSRLRLPRTGWASTRPRPRSPPCTATHRRRRRPTGRRSWSGTTSCLALTGSPVVALNRAVVVGEVDGPLCLGLAALRAMYPRTCRRRTAVQAWLTERAGDRPAAHALYAAAASQAGNLAERDHLVRQAARLHGSG